VTIHAQRARFNCHRISHRIGVGAFCGAAIGLIVTVTKVPSLVVSLAALYIIRGILNIIGLGIQIEPTAIPLFVSKIGFETFAGIPWIFIIPALVALGVGFSMRSFRSMRELYAIGSNPWCRSTGRACPWRGASLPRSW